MDKDVNLTEPATAASQPIDELKQPQFNSTHFGLWVRGSTHQNKKK